MSILNSKKQSLKEELVYRPAFYSLPKDEKALEKLLEENDCIQVFDSLELQLEELIECRHPRGIDKESLEEEKKKWLGEKNWNEAGIWVYYPWNYRLVHVLDEKEFIEVRTNRNQYKITPEERDELQQKTVGIIGLSVGQSIALTLAMERSCGSMRLADFDVLELSNLNRIRTPLSNIKLPKVVATAREIAEIDPFIAISLFRDGIKKDNLDDFLLDPHPLDLLVDECDGLDVKILAREKARQKGIPVIMDTSDRGMLDIERFDLDSTRPLFHGLAGDLSADDLEGLSNAEKIPYILKILGAKDLSPRAKASAMEVNQSLSTWPQLASSVVLGGAAAADVARRIMLDEINQSGRYFIDVESIIPSKEKQSLPLDTREPKEFTLENARNILGIKSTEDKALGNELVHKLIHAANLAPSGGNVQPWKWLVNGKTFHLFLDKKRAKSFLDFAHTGSYYAFGSAIENFLIEADKQGYGGVLELKPSAKAEDYMAKIKLVESGHPEADKDFRPDLYDMLPIRVTNRKNEGRQKLNQGLIEKLQSTANNWPEARLILIEEEEKLSRLSEIASEVERLRLLDKQGHYDTFKELRWSEEEARRTKDGMDIKTLELDRRGEAGIKLSSDWEAVRYLREWELGGALSESMKATIRSASTVGLIVMNDSFKPETFMRGGRLGQQIWMEANMENVSFQPISPSTFFFNRMIYGKEIDMNTYMREKLHDLYPEFLSIFDLEKKNNREQTLIFMFRLNIASEPTERALRLPVEKVLLNKS
jgi:molybdopterin/thiamine biosynthesis adenylyltransferase/nitroreductase